MGKNQDLDPGWKTRIIFTAIFWVKILKFFDEDQGCGKNSDPESGMENSDLGETSRIRNTGHGPTTLPPKYIVYGMTYLKSEKRRENNNSYWSRKVQHSATILATAILSWERFLVSSMIFSFSWFHSPACKGTVSWDRFGFWWHVWLVLGLKSGRGYISYFFAAQMILWHKVYFSRISRLMRVYVG